MTSVRIDIRQMWSNGQYLSVKRGMVWSPTSIIVDTSSLIIPEPFPVITPYAPIVIEVPHSDFPRWVWRVVFWVDTVRHVKYVIVPETNEVIDYEDLQEVDASSLVEPNGPNQAWYIALTEVEERLGADIAQAVQDFMDQNPNVQTKPGFFTGVGAPTTIVGSSPGDTYLDLDSYNLYRLGA
jgi:hypothetical protein